MPKDVPPAFIGTRSALLADPMIRANCRDRFTAEDFTFIVRTLGKSRADSVSLTELLSDQDTRDSILDHELLFQAILSATAQPVHFATTLLLCFDQTCLERVRSAGSQALRLHRLAARDILPHRAPQVPGRWLRAADPVSLRPDARVAQRLACPDLPHPRARRQLLALSQRHLPRAPSRPARSAARPPSVTTKIWAA